MSRIGKQPIKLPDKVKFAVNGGKVVAEGPKGKVERRLPPQVSVSVENNVVHVKRDGDTREARAYHGLTRALLANMVTGVSKGYSKTLVINGVGFRADQSGNKIVFKLGYTEDKVYTLPPSVKTTIEEKGTIVTLESADKEALGEAAAVMRRFKVPDPYKLKGVKYKDEVIKQKEGKAGA